MFMVDTGVPARAGSIPLKRQDIGVFTLPVSVNDALTIDFVPDTSAPRVTLPQYIVLTLMRAGPIKPDREQRALAIVSS